VRSLPPRQTWPDDEKETKTMHRHVMFDGGILESFDGAPHLGLSGEPFDDDGSEHGGVLHQKRERIGTTSHLV
jgi:hypothetical protein